MELHKDYLITSETAKKLQHSKYGEKDKTKMKEISRIGFKTTSRMLMRVKTKTVLFIQEVSVTESSLLLYSTMKTLALRLLRRCS